MGGEPGLSLRELNRFLRLLGRVLRKADYRILLEAKFKNSLIEKLRRSLVSFALYLKSSLQSPGALLPFFLVCSYVQLSLSHEKDMLLTWKKLVEAIKARELQFALGEELSAVLMENSGEYSARIEDIRKIVLRIIKEMEVMRGANCSAGSV